MFSSSFLLKLFIISAFIANTRPQTPTTARPATPTTTTSAPTPPSKCPEGWLDLYSDGCFLPLPEAVGVNWIAAYQICEELDSVLAEIYSDQTQRILESILQHEESFTGHDNWWIGLNDKGKEGVFIWNFMSEFPSYLHWANNHPSSPDSGNTQDCVYMGTDYFWYDGDCKAESKFAPLCWKMP